MAGHLFSNIAMDLKPAKTIPELIELLKVRGLCIPNESQALAYLNDNGYYHLNIYFHKYMKIIKDQNGVRQRLDEFNKNTSFEDIVKAHENDRWLRIEILRMIEPIEHKVKSAIIQHISNKYGPGAFQEPICFHSVNNYLNISNYIENIIDQRKDDPIVQVHLTKYNGKFHAWAILELMSLNNIAKVFSCLKNPDKKLITSRLGFNHEYFHSWITSLGDLRNICAHHNYLFRRVYLKTPKLMKQFGWPLDQNKKLFALFLIIKQLSNKTFFNEVMNYITFRDIKSNFLNMADYGFPKNYDEYL